MNTAIKVRDNILRLFGFKKNSRYVTNYLNDANIKSTVYMSFIIIVLEIWMIIRNVEKYVIGKDAKQEGFNLFSSMFIRTSQFWLFLFAGVAMFIFSIYYLKTKYKVAKRLNTVNIVFGSILSGYAIFFLIGNFTLNLLSFNNNVNTVSSISTISLGFIALLLGVACILFSIFNRKRVNDILYLVGGVLTVIFFAAMCLIFGVSVSYGDFFRNWQGGLPRYYASTNSYADIKSIICFLTMVIYVACLLIWRPWISIIMLVGIFVGFYYMVALHPELRAFPDGERINYITFVITLVVVSMSIYIQRLNEAEKDEKLERIAIEDSLTGIYNYRYFNELATLVLTDPETDINSKVFLFINIENFKTYNDQKGFKKGNEFLIEFANNIVSAFENDIVARQADDHFVVLGCVGSFEGKIEILKDLLANESEVFLELKVGGYRPKSRDDDPYHACDKARYACGRIKYKYNQNYLEYSEEMDEKFHKIQYIVNHIDEAVDNGYIKAYYQPVVWSNNGELCGCEALARWIDPKYGFLSPGDFIPVLEEHRQIHKLDKAIFEIVCKDIRNSLDNNLPIVPISLNFSRLDFELMDAVGALENLMARYDIPKDYIHVEITESALTDNVGLLKQSLDKFHDDGFAIWLDDFGSGYSSLNVLKDYSFDVLKIDMKFVVNFDINPKASDIIDCIIQLAERIGMKTLTEGVETKEQAEFLKKSGCGRLQGYLFGKPIPLSDLQDQVSEGKYTISDKII